MPSTRVIITILAGVAALIAYFASKGSYPPKSSWPLGWAMGALIVVYVVGSVLWGVVEGMREAGAKRGSAASSPGPKQPR